MERVIEEWVAVGVIDATTADRLRAYEGRRRDRPGMRWPVLLALGLGGVLVGAGVLLFVSAHWDRLSPSSRLALVLAMVAFFHVVAAATASRFAALASVLHAVGTASLGAGIFLAGQIFNLQEHWPGGIMLWAAGAWIGWLLLRDWPQAALASILTPAWLAGEWILRTERLRGAVPILGQGLVLLAATYLSARTREQDGAVRRTLAWIGGLSLIPCVVCATQTWEWGRQDAMPAGLRAAGWIVGLAGPVALAWWLRGRAAWMNALAAAWAACLPLIAGLGSREAPDRVAALLWRELALYGWCGIGAIGLIAWGLREGRSERINLGVAGFALTVLAFYFSSVMDKLGRAASLIGLGALFLVGGFILERARRRLIARLKGSGA